MDEKKAVDSGALEYFHDKLKGEFTTPAQAKDIARERIFCAGKLRQCTRWQRVANSARPGNTGHERALSIAVQLRRR